MSIGQKFMLKFMLKNPFENAEIHCIKSFGFINAPFIGIIMLHQNIGCCMCVVVYGWMNNLIMNPYMRLIKILKHAGAEQGHT